MKKSREPWLDWDNALAEAEAARAEQAEKAGRKNKRDKLTAFGLLLFYGLVGAHRFYLYDAKKGWQFFWAYILFGTCFTVGSVLLPEEFQSIPIIIFFVIWGLLLFYEVPYVKKRLVEINEEVENYDR